MKSDIKNEMDIYLLIDTFYEKILKHEKLSYFFKDAVNNWPYHKQQFVKYWSKQILFTDSYDGSPLPSHIAIDQRFDRSFERSHFDDWLALWVETVDQLFQGEKAKLAKESGQNMAKNIHLKMFVNRKPG